MATAWEILFGFGVALSLVFGYVIARLTKRRSSEIHSHHLLVISAVINLLACCLVGFLASSSWLIRTAISAQPDPLNLLLVLPFAVPGAAVVLAYARGAQRIRRKYALEVAPTPLTRHVEDLASRLGLHRTGVYTSDKIPTPFAFGQLGSPPSIAIPARWELTGKEAKVVLLHELSHILNGDTVFTTGAGLLVRRLKFLPLLLLPLGLAIGFGGESAGLLAYLGLLYAYCAISFSVLFCMICRSREILADITMAQFAGVAEAGKSLLEIDLKDALLVHSGVSHAELGSGTYLKRAKRWLADRALFGRARGFWVGLRKALTYLFSRTSEHRVHMHDLLDRSRGAETEPVPTKESAFWIGFAASTFLALLLIGCQIWEKMVAGSEVGYAFKYLMDTGYVLSFPLFVLVTCVFALPAWSEQSMAGFSVKYLFSLMLRYEFFLLGSLAGFVLLIAFFYSPTERAVAVIAHAILIGFVIVMSGLMTIMSVVIYHRFPRSDRRFWGDMAGLASHFALPLILTVSLLVPGAWYVLSGEYAVGWGIIGGLFGGFYVLLVGTKGVFSRDDRYIVSAFPAMGKLMKTELSSGSLARANFTYAVNVVTIGVPTGVAVYLAVKYILAGVYWWITGFALAGTVVFLSLLAATSRRLSFSSEHRASVSDLCEALSLLRVEAPRELMETIGEIGRWWGSGLSENSGSGKWESRTCRDVCEMATIVAWGKMGPVQKEQIAGWILRCECTDGGFGIWPGSQPRLSMTYCGLQSLQSLGCLDRAAIEKHVRWIQTLRSDGAFRDSLARREVWEDTFFVIKSLALMGRPGLGDGDDTVRTLESFLWQAVQRVDMKALWYCVESLSLLGHNEKRPAVEQLIRRAAFDLSIAKPLYAAGTIRSVIEAAKIVFSSHDDVVGLFPEDSLDRLMRAVEQELDPVVKRLRKRTAKRNN